MLQGDCAACLFGHCVIQASYSSVPSVSFQLLIISSYTNEPTLQDQSPSLYHSSNANSQYRLLNMPVVEPDESNPHCHTQVVGVFIRLRNVNVVG
jgi:hypothetical protein